MSGEAIHMKKRADDFAELSPRARNLLRLEGYNTKEDVAEGVKAGAIRPNKQNKKGILHYGPKTHAEVCRWIGVSVEVNDTNKRSTGDSSAGLGKPRCRKLAQAVRSSPRAFEKALREHLGLSCREAKRATGGGWRALAKCKHKESVT